MSTTDPFQQALHHHHAGQWAEARAAYERCLALNPQYGDALTNLGRVCRQLGDLPSARTHLEHAIRVAPQDPGAHYNLGNLYSSCGETVSAITAYQTSLACATTPGQTAQAAYNLALTLSETGDKAGAEAAYEQTLAATPGHLDAALNHAALLASQGRLSEARGLYETLAQQHPHDARVINNLAGLYQDMGDIPRAQQLLDQAIALQADRPEPRSNRLMALQYQPGIDATPLKQAAQQWGEWASQRATALLGHPPQRQFPDKLPGSLLRIGYLSADLCMHPVGLFIKNIIAHHDPAVVTPIIYGNGSTRDAVFAAIIQAARVASSTSLTSRKPPPLA